MIDNNIIQSLGAGSGIDTNNLVKQLTEIERSAPQNRIDTKREKTETQISDFGLLSNAMATLKDAATVLSDPEGLFSKTASYTDSTALVPVELDTDVQAGSYTFEVEAIAVSQSITSASFENVSDAVGEGVLTFRFGDVTAAAGAMTGFAQDVDADVVEITIDGSNNTLEGLRDSINDADFGVQATIVNDGSGFRLQINAESGANNELEITAAEAGGSPTDNDEFGLSRFSFNTTASQLTQNQDGQDAQIKINGLTVTRESNTIDDIVQGLKFDVLKAAPGEPITVTVNDDKAFAEQNIRDFVEAYNLFLEAIEPAIGSTEVENEDGKKETVIGSLASDALAKSFISRIRSVISSSIPGLSDTSFTTLGTVGIRTELDGSLSIDDKTFKASMDDSFEEVQKLFSPQTASDSAGVYINTYNDNTAAGAYDIVITTPPARGEYQGGVLDPALDTGTGFPNFDTTGKSYTFKVNVNGIESAELTLPTAIYENQSDIADALQVLINTDETLKAANAVVSVNYDSDNNRFDFISTAYGDSSIVSFSESSADSATDLGLAVAAGTAGATVVGTVNGVAGFGSANVLLPALSQPGQGMGMIIGEGATTATVNFSRGFAGELEATLEEFLQSNGLIDTRESTLTSTLDSLETDETALDRKMTAYEDRLMNQFIAMERILNGLNTSGGFLENLIDTLPFTAKK